MAFQTLGTVLNTWEKGQQRQHSYQLRVILQNWSDIVGIVVAKHTKPLFLQNDILRVATSSSAWAQNLAFERQQIVAKLNQQLHLSVQDVRFTPGQWRPTSEADSAQQPIFQAHPSWVAPLQVQRVASAQDLQTTFQTWATVMQARTRSLPQCPRCQCPSPPGELQRWSVCALCVAQQWSQADASPLPSKAP
jgi:predicted nucleic acid-binding Zn ribbon protein